MRFLAFQPHWKRYDQSTLFPQCGKSKNLLSIEKYFVKSIYTVYSESIELISQNFCQKECLRNDFVISTLFVSIYFQTVRFMRCFEESSRLLKKIHARIESSFSQNFSKNKAEVVKHVGKFITIVHIILSPLLDLELKKTAD